MAKRKTNMQLLQAFSRDIGPMSEMMMMEAIGRYIKQVAEAEPIVHGLIDGHAWKRCAIKMQDALEAHYKS